MIEPPSTASSERVRICTARWTAQRLSALRELPSEPSWSFPPRPWTHHVCTIALHPIDPDWLAVGIELGGRHYAWAQALDPADPDLWYVAISRSPFSAHGHGDGQARLFRSRGDGFAAIDSWGDTPELRRMPYALSILPARPDHLLVGLRGGTLLLTGDAGESWSRLPVRLPDVIEVAVGSVPVREGP